MAVIIFSLFVLGFGILGVTLIALKYEPIAIVDVEEHLYLIESEETHIDG